MIGGEGTRQSNLSSKYRQLKDVTFTNALIGAARQEGAQTQRNRAQQVIDGGDKFQDAKRYMMKTERKQLTAKKGTTIKIKLNLEGAGESSKNSRNLGRQSIPISCTSKSNAQIPNTFSVNISSTTKQISPIKNLDKSNRRYEFSPNLLKL